MGPDTSLLIAELVMTAADDALQSRLNIAGYRYVDDIELAFGTAAQADAALGPLQEELARYELALNPSKTRIEALPAASEEPWISQLRDFRIRTKPSLQKSDLIKYFDVAFALAREFPRKTILNYTVAKLRSVEVDHANGTLLQDLVLQSLVNEAGVTRFALEILIRSRAAGLRLDLDKLSGAIATTIIHNAEVLERDDFVPFFAMLKQADVGFYDSEIELAKIDRPLDQLRGLNMPVLGFVFGY